MPGPSANPTLAALIKLLDEPDESAFGLVRGQILLYGQEAIAHLENVLDNNFNELIRERCTSMIQDLSRNENYQSFCKWLQNDPSDLLKGYILVSKTRYPDLDEEQIIIQIEQMKMDIWLELNEELTALEIVKVLNHLIFDVHRFEPPNSGDAYAPRNTYINTLLEFKKGSPLSLGILYIILAQKLGIPIYGVNLPVNFLLAYLTGSGLKNPGEKDVLFYINPFQKGSLLTRTTIEQFIRQLKLRPDDSYYSPSNNREIIRQLINNLIYYYNDNREHDKASDLDTLLNAYE
jgi:regulator of sirC expression with transglutaminase-like and TPR domain